MKSKKIQLALLSLMVSVSIHAQFIVKVNDKEVSPGQELSLADSKTMELSFKKPKKIAEYTSGRASLYMKITSETDEVIAIYDYTVDGYKAANNFLYPGSPIFYTIWVPDNVKMDMTLSSGNGITHFRKNFMQSVKYRRLKVTTHLTFEESITWDKYGKAQVLLEPMTFYFDVWSKNNKISMPAIGATYTYPGQGEYQNMEFDNSTQSSYGTARILTDNVKYSIQTASLQKFNISTISISGTQDNELNTLKANFETFLSYIANTCNGKKVLKNIPVPDGTIDWEQFSGYSKSAVLAELDQTNNPNHASVKLMEPVTVGSLSGLKFTGTKKTYKCAVKDAIITTVEGPADPSRQEYISTVIFYLLKHPAMPNKLIAVTYRWVDNNGANASTASQSAIIEEFLKGLSF